LGAVITAIATVVFLISKFTEGAWVVVIAIPAFIVLFVRIHAYYERTRHALALGERPAKPEAKYTVVIVPIVNVSRLTAHALCEAESLGQEVIAVTVVLRTGEDAVRYTDTLRHRWRRWNPGVPLTVLHTDYASVVEPVVEFIDSVRAEHPDDQIVVLIPVVRPAKFRYRILHNQIDLVLSRVLRKRDDIVVARVSMPIPDDAPPSPGPEPPAAGHDGTVGSAPVSTGHA
jgi:hypothetical protein